MAVDVRKLVEEWVRRNPEEAMRIVCRLFQPGELLRVGNRSYVRAFEGPLSRFDPGELRAMLDGGSCLPDPPTGGVIRDPRHLFTDFVTTEASYVIFGEDTDGDGVLDIIYAKNGRTGEIEFSGTDAATVIQQAIDALKTTGGKILIKRGVYIINSRITLADFSWCNITIQGEGRGTVLKHAPDTNFSMGMIYVYRSHGVVIMDIAFDGNKDNVPTPPSRFYDQNIYAKECRYFTVINTWHRDSEYDSILVHGTSDHVMIIGNHIKDAGDPTHAGGIGITFHGPNPVRYSIILGNVIENPNSHGIELHWPEVVSVVGNSIYDQGEQGITVAGAGKEISIVGNVIRSTKTDNYGIYVGATLDDVYGISILGNVIDGCGAGSEGIKLTVDGDYILRDVVVEGNTIRNFKEDGIWVTREAGASDYIQDISIVGNAIMNITGGTKRVAGIVAAEGRRLAIVGNVIWGDSSYGICGCGNNSVVANNIIVRPTGGGTAGMGIANSEVIIEGNFIDNYKRGIYITGGADILVRGNRIRAQAGGYDVSITNGDNICFIENIFMRGSVNILGGTNIVFKRNVGYTTENSGVVTITGDGTTTTFLLNITHGLVSDNLTATFMCKRPATFKWWLVDTNSDDFYETIRVEVTFDTAPADGETVEIYWQAEAT